MNNQEEKLIPYPKTKPINIRKFSIKSVPELKAESDFEGFERTGKIYTPVYNYLKLGNKKQTVVLIAEEVCKNLPAFMENLNTLGCAVYKNYTFAEEELHGWLKDNKIRLLHQSKENDTTNVFFDILVDKVCFYEFAEKLIKRMEEIAAQKVEWYKEYLETKDEFATEKLGEWAKEMLKPENIIGSFNTTEELMKSLLGED